MTSKTPTFKEMIEELLLSEEVKNRDASAKLFNDTGSKRTRLEKKKSSKGQSRRSQSVENLQEEKILNVESEADKFMSISDIFEDAVNQLTIDEDNFVQVLDKLIEIENLVKKKIFSLNLERKSSRTQIKNMDSQSLASSTLSLHSNASFSETYSREKLSFKEFLINVNCPFCSKLQTDKVNLIKHLDEYCEAQIQKKFDKKDHIPFSSFQILPTNTFKCNVCQNSVHRNLKQYFMHLQSDHHISVFSKASKTKNYSELLFCSCCKVQVFNTYTQIDFHINHEVHKMRSESRPNLERFFKKEIHCVYFKNKKFKCLKNCPSLRSFYKTPKEILQHFEDSKHIKSVQNLSLVYCEICYKELHILEVMNHFSSSEHNDREKNEVTEERFELCFYCGFLCDNLMELSLHMKSKCNVINDIRKHILKSDKFAKKDLKKEKKINRSRVEGSKNNGGFIIVKDYTNMQELYKYFIKFGEITVMEKYDDSNVLIKFQEKNAVEDIFLIRDTHKINTVKIEVTTELSTFCEEREESKEESSRRILSENFKSRFSSTGHENEEEALTSCSTLQNDQLQSLFQRMSSHLMNNTLKLDSANKKKIASDCIKVLKAQCGFVGFFECGLSFSLENISLNCNTGLEFFRECNEDLFLNDCDFSTNYVTKMYTKMCESELWEQVITRFESPFPHIKCTHKDTQRTCIITFSRSAMILTNMLRHIMKKNDFVRPFCLIIRFWLTVNELKIKEFEYGLISLFIFFLLSEKIVEFSVNVEPMTSDVSLLYNSVQAYPWNNIDFGWTQGTITRKKCDAYKLSEKIEHHQLKVAIARLMEQFNDAIKNELSSNPNSSSRASFKTLNVAELFYRFLPFLSAFDFDRYCICLPLTCPVEKRTLLKSINFLRPDEILKSMCIIDPLLRVNLTEGINQEDVKSLKKIVSSSMKDYRL